MSAIRIRKTIDSETLTLPELKPFIGRTVEIAIEEPTPADVKKEFWDFALITPTTEEEYDAWQEGLKRWRGDARFREFWSIIDHNLQRDWNEWLEHAAVIEATAGLENYDFDALPEMDAADIRRQKELWS